MKIWHCSTERGGNKGTKNWVGDRRKENIL